MALKRSLFLSLSFLAPLQFCAQVCTSLASPWSQRWVSSFSKNLKEILNCPLTSELLGAGRHRMIVDSLCVALPGGKAAGPLQGHCRVQFPIQKENDLL